MNLEQDKARIDEALKVLGEHFDSVHIFATRHESGEHEGTLRFAKGVGNWFARYGQIVAWVETESEANKSQITRTINYA